MTNPWKAKVPPLSTDTVVQYEVTALDPDLNAVTVKGHDAVLG
jgi:hypothetical protein